MPALRLNKSFVFTVVFVAALVLRLIFVFQWDVTPYGAKPVLDAQVYDNWAQAIAQGHFLRAKAFYGSPLFPYILGLLYAAFGHDLLICGVLNSMLGACTAVVLSGITLECFGLTAALVTGLLASFYMPAIFYTAPVMKEPLALFLLAVYLQHALRLMKDNRLRDYIWCGVSIGLCALVRGNSLLMAPVILLLAFGKWRRASLRPLVTFIGVLVLCILPATLHNAIVSHDFVPINYAYGFNLYIGNSATANGTNAYPPEISSDPVQEEFATVWEARAALGRDVKPSEVSSYWSGRALDFILHNPVADLLLLRNKALAFWNATDAFDNYDIGFIRKNFDTLVTLPLPSFWLVLSLAVFGAFAAWVECQETVALLVVFAFAYMASVLMFYVTDRYRLPVITFLLPLAGAALPYGWRLVRGPDRRRLGAAAVLTAASLLITFQPFPGAVDLTGFDWGVLSTIYADSGRDEEALDALRRAYAISPTDAGAQAYVRAAMIEERLGREAEAEKFLKMATTYYPTNGVVEYNYGRFLAAQGNIKEALAAFIRARNLTPSYALTYYALAKVYERLGDRAHALESVWHGLAVDPADPLLHETLEHLQKT
ncbi:MAG: tetratricopeptide repeat protein [Pseudomonadota bacterium]|nr:tetratricopeptide repeat protein [Pseudomonadota bacterium]